MQSDEIRSRFLTFFEKRGHAIIPSAPLVPENDPSVLFNTAGMQPLVPYLMGQKHPSGTRLVNVQKCVRTQDIDEVGDNTHDTFFEMLGNWSLGDYFKEDAIAWSYEFLTSKEEGLGLDPKRLYVTCFEGDENAPKDTEAFEIWRKFIPENRIYFMGAKSNWWSVGDNGPCGPDTEMFYDVTEEGLGDLTKEQYMKADDEQKVVEVWNDVFMQYEKKDGKVIGKLSQPNVDTGSGLERVVMAVQGKDNIFDTDLFIGIIQRLEEIFPNSKLDLPIENIEGSRKFKIKAKRIIADHIRTSVMMINDGVLPGNKGRDYILRRLIRRALVWSRAFSTDLDRIRIAELTSIIVEKYENTYTNLKINEQKIFNILRQESSDFNKTLERGLKELKILSLGIHRGGNVDPISDYVERKNRITGEELFSIFSTHGFPIELSLEYIKEQQKTEFNDFDEKQIVEDFNKKMSEHQKLSQTASAGMFKGGLANHNEKTIKLHTAHHLLLAGLQAVVSKDIKQKGSNITEERLRLDFVCDHKLTDEEKKNVEDWVNDKISQGLNVVRREMPLGDAEKLGAQMEFGAKYPDMVSVYFIEDEKGNQISKEFCGGPHVSNTKELNHFKIQKEEAVSSGVRRIKAVLQ